MDNKLWSECVRFHGHACPGLAMGYRATEIGMEVLGIPLEKVVDEEIVCVAENDACGVDSVQCLISCTIGKGNLIMRPSGKMAFSFFDRRAGKSTRIVFKPRDRTDDREEAMRVILTASKNDLVDIKVPTYSVPEKARLFDSVKCDVCGEYSRDDKIRLGSGKKYCQDCFVQYDR